MSDMNITITLPEELVNRAKAVGVPLDTQSDQIIALLEAQIRKREAAQRLQKTGQLLQELPDNLKPTPEEIEAEIQAYWAEQSSDKNDHS